MCCGSAWPQRPQVRPVLTSSSSSRKNGTWRAFLRSALAQPVEQYRPSTPLPRPISNGLRHRGQLDSGLVAMAHLGPDRGTASATRPMIMRLAWSVMVLSGDCMSRARSIPGA
jgi:hypothetical protein